MSYAHTLPSVSIQLYELYSQVIAPLLVGRFATRISLENSTQIFTLQFELINAGDDVKYIVAGRGWWSYLNLALIHYSWNQQANIVTAEGNDSLFNWRTC